MVKLQIYLKELLTYLPKVYDVKLSNNQIPQLDYNISIDFNDDEIDVQRKKL